MMRCRIHFIVLILIAVVEPAVAFHLCLPPKERPTTTASPSLGCAAATTPLENQAEEEKAWVRLGEIATISSPWVSIFCERLQDNAGATVDYWRVEKPASCIVLTLLHDNRLVLPRSQYRPGVGRTTLDFCGGRCDATCPQDAVGRILQRELGLGTTLDTHVESVTPLNPDAGWIINSSFSNQLLFGFVVRLKDGLELNPDVLHPVQYDNAHDLLPQLTCLQCRAVLMEWMLREQQKLT